MPRKHFLLHKHTFLGNLQINTQPILLLLGSCLEKDSALTIRIFSMIFIAVLVALEIWLRVTLSVIDKIAN